MEHTPPNPALWFEPPAPPLAAFSVPGETGLDADSESDEAGPALAAQLAAYGGPPPDGAERERLLLEQLPQVRYVARRIAERLPAHVPFEDLVQAGVLGLIDAIHKYDPAKNAQLTTYARFRIRGAILDSLRAMDWSPRELRQQARELQHAHNRLEAQLGRAPVQEELAAAMNLELVQLQRLQFELNGLDQVSAGPANEDGLESSPLDLLATPDPSPFALCQTAERKRVLAGIIEDLPERERQILSLYYYEELTMKEVGAVLGIGESRISQIHSALLKRLRAALAERGISAQNVLPAS